MKFFKSSFLIPLLLFSVALEILAQNDCEECRPQNNQRNNFVIQEAFLSDEFGKRLTAQECTNSQPQSVFWITLNYTSRQELENVKLVFDLLINNSLGNMDYSVNIKYDVGTVASTNAGEQKSVTIKIDLGAEKKFNCSNQVLELLNTRAFWIANGQFNPNGPCGGYSPGQCSNPPLVIIPVGVAGFIYDFDYVINCVDDDDPKLDITFFVTTLAGGKRPAEIDWSFKVNNGNPITQEKGGFSYTLANLNPGDVITPDLKINKSFSDKPFTIPPSITVPSLFNIKHTATDDNENISSDPNGSIVIEIIDQKSDDYLYFWTDEVGNILNPVDPQNLTGLSDGTYKLTMVNQTTGVCRIFEFPLKFTPLPVLFGDMSINFLSSGRNVEFNWSTTKEWENSHFEVQRSFQNMNKWTVVGKVEGSGFSDEPVYYKFEDKEIPLTGGNLYYRLRQVDFSGKSELTKVLSVRTPPLQFTKGVWRAYPNPTDSDQLRVSLLDRSQYNDEYITFKIIHPTAITKAVSVSSENEMNEAIAKMIGNISMGVFVIEVAWGQKVEHIKVLKK
jgi:hypothetical protein